MLDPAVGQRNVPRNVRMRFFDLIRYVGWTWRFRGTGYVKPVREHPKAIGLAPLLINMLQEVQDDSGVYIDISEGKPPTTEGSHVKDSEHFQGEGADVRAANGIERMKLVKSGLKIGFKRIGVYTKHVHFGVSTTLPQNVMWAGVSN